MAFDGRARNAQGSGGLGHLQLPAALAQGVVTSAGCIGNRVYTDLGEDELYTVVPGRALPRVADALQTIAAANAQLAEYHRGRRQTLECCPSA